ncbi:hypothetical protein RRG08_037585, partial [Elysia crispata]
MEMLLCRGSVFLVLLLIFPVAAVTDCERQYSGTCINKYFNSCLPGYGYSLSGCGYQEMCCVPPIAQVATPPISNGQCGLTFPDTAVPHQRIVGGTPALRGEFPWQVRRISATPSF